MGSTGIGDLIEDEDGRYLIMDIDVQTVDGVCTVTFHLLDDWDPDEDEDYRS